MQVIRFFHLRPLGMSRPNMGGCCVRVTGDTEHPHQVSVQKAFCSRKDAYAKKVGRDLAEKATPKIVPLRYLPQELARIEQEAGKLVRSAGMRDFPADYTFAIKYFLPKE